jgi:hypothetical protein
MAEEWRQPVGMPCLPVCLCKGGLRPRELRGAVGEAHLSSPCMHELISLLAQPRLRLGVELL